MAGEIERSQSISLNTRETVSMRKRSSSIPNDFQRPSFTDVTRSLGDSPKVYMMTTMEEELHSPCNGTNRAPSILGNLSGKKEETKFRQMYWAAFAALLSAVAMGMATGYSSPATYDMEKREGSRIKVTDDEITWIGSMVALGALTGGLIAGPFADKLGRKDALIYNSAPFLLGWLLIVYAPTVLVVLIGRFITGVACGIISVTVPMYAVEISTPEVRGLLGASYQMFLVVGNLITMTIGAFITWTWLAVAGAVTVVAGLICLCPMPESPRWLVAHDRWEESIKAIDFFQGGYLDAKSESTAIMEDLKTQPKGKLALRDFLNPTVYKPTLLSAAQMFFQQFSGANAVLYYTSSIFESSGSSLDPKTSAIIISGIQVVATLLSTFLMDRAGRRVLILLSGLFMGLSMISLGAFSFLDHQDQNVRLTMGWIPLTSLIVFITAFSLGYGPIPWLMVAEMVPVRARSIVSGMATFFNGLFAFTVTKTFKMMQEMIYPYGAFWTYGGISLLGCIFMWFFLPETKGRRLEDIQKVFIQKKQAEESRTISTITLRENV